MLLSLFNFSEIQHNSLSCKIRPGISLKSLILRIFTTCPWHSSPRRVKTTDNKTANNEGRNTIIIESYRFFISLFSSTFYDTTYEYCYSSETLFKQDAYYGQHLLFKDFFSANLFFLCPQRGSKIDSKITKRV